MKVVNVLTTILLNVLYLHQTHPHHGDVHAERIIPQHPVLHLARGAVTARGGRHHAAHRRADQAIRYDVTGTEQMLEIDGGGHFS